MDDFLEEEGARLLEECARLNADPNAAVPESLRMKCMESFSELLMSIRPADNTAKQYIWNLTQFILKRIRLCVEEHKMNGLLQNSLRQAIQHVKRNISNSYYRLRVYLVWSYKC